MAGFIERGFHRKMGSIARCVSSEEGRCEGISTGARWAARLTTQGQGREQTGSAGGASPRRRGVSMVSDHQGTPDGRGAGHADVPRVG
jgi:hypothetical protein